MNYPLVTIIVPVYNKEHCFGKCLESITGQTYLNIEIIVINDGSTDGSLNICKKYSHDDPRFVIIDQPNKGLSSARNAGLDIARGEFLAFVDSDDWVEPDFIESLYKTLINNNADLSQCGYLWHKRDKIIVSKSPKEYILDRKSALNLLFDDNIVKNFVWNKFYKRSLFEEIRFPIGRIYEDIFVMYKIFDRCKTIAFVNSPKYHYIFYDNSLMNNNNLELTGVDFFEPLLAQFKFAKEAGLWRKGEARIVKYIINYLSKVIRLSPNGEYIIGHLCLLLKSEFSYKGLIKLSPLQAFRRYMVLNHFNLFAKVSKLSHKKRK